MRLCSTLTVPALLAASVLASAAWAEPKPANAPATGNTPAAKTDPAEAKAECGLKVGDRAPKDVALLTADNESVSLADMYAKGPVVVTFYRGGWCPYCTKALAGWEEKMPELKAAGATFVAVTPESPANAGATATKAQLSMMVLSDSDMSAAKGFKVYFDMDEQTIERYKGYGLDLPATNASKQWSLAAPATFVIDRGGMVRYAFADWDYKKRANPDEVIAAVKALQAPTTTKTQ